jgi:hypothetical protein
LPEPVDLETAFLDTARLAVNIHYAVDWVLLRDATRSLMKAIILIRDEILRLLVLYWFIGSALILFGPHRDQVEGTATLPTTAPGPVGGGL